jgi:flavin-dependent dehydrogenase
MPPHSEDTWSDVIVCGGGPAGVAAAIAAARTGARVTLIEVHGCLGGIWTAGALSWIIDASLKPGVMAEVIRRLDDAGGHGGHGTPDFSYDVEVMKLVLDQMCMEAGVRVLLHTRVVAVDRNDAGSLRAVVTESKAGRQRWTGRVFVDTTGDGDVAALRAAIESELRALGGRLRA